MTTRSTPISFHNPLRLMRDETGLRLVDAVPIELPKPALGRAHAMPNGPVASHCRSAHGQGDHPSITSG
jgi:hypothetical protein